MRIREREKERGREEDKGEREREGGGERGQNIIKLQSLYCIIININTLQHSLTIL